MICLSIHQPHACEIVYGDPVLAKAAWVPVEAMPCR